VESLAGQLWNLPSTQFTAIAAYKAFLASGGNSSLFVAEISPFIFRAPVPIGSVFTQETGYPLAYDAACILYSGNLDQSLHKITPSGTVTTLLHLT
jgi:hypothetical protein